MIRREIEVALMEAAARYPVVTVTGPRQSGKTTVCRAVFPRHDYVSLEAPDMREFAHEDPRGFLGQFDEGAILDEVQNVPELLSYIQGLVDDDPSAGRFVLTGSQHFALSEKIAQSLAGRTAVLHLLPPSLDELRRFDNAPETLWQTLFAGAFPRIFDADIAPQHWLADYVATYVQRDVRQVLNIGDLNAFTGFLRLVAGRTSAELNLSDIGADVGVSHNTAKAWLSVLETSFLAFTVPPFHANFRKRVVKAPKLHVIDSGLICYLLGIESADQLVTHPLRGAIFESWVASEIRKTRLHNRRDARLYHLRLTRGAEVDLLVDVGTRVIGTEMKSGATARSSFFGNLTQLAELLAEREPGRSFDARVVYGGEASQRRSVGELIAWSDIHEFDWG